MESFDKDLVSYPKCNKIKCCQSRGGDCCFRSYNDNFGGRDE